MRPPGLAVTAPSHAISSLLPPPLFCSPTDGLGPRFLPYDDATVVPELPQFSSMLGGVPIDGSGGAAVAADETELRELLREMRGSADAGNGALPSRWSPMDAAPSLCDVEPTTAGWGSGGPAAAPFGPADTYQVTDTAGTPFHFPAHPAQHPHQFYMAPPPPFAHHPAMMMPPMPPHPMMQGAVVYPRPAPPSPWNVGPVPPGAVPYPPGAYAAFPPAAYYAPVPPHMMQPIPYGYPFMAAAACAAAAAAPHMAGGSAATTATGTTSARVVPTLGNNRTTSSYLAGSTTDGGSSGDEGAGRPVAITAAALAKPRSVSSTDYGLQVVPDAGMMLVPYGGGMMAVPRPPHMAHTTPPPVAHTSTRAACLARYRQKKAVRSFGKHIRYHMRKVNADKRPRVKGRFIKSAVITAVAEDLNNEMDVAADDEIA